MDQPRARLERDGPDAAVPRQVSLLPCLAIASVIVVPLLRSLVTHVDPHVALLTQCVARASDHRVNRDFTQMAADYSFPSGATTSIAAFE